MDPSHTSLEFDRVLSLVALEARTDPGRSAVLERRPSSSLEVCERMQAELMEMVAVVHRDGLMPLAGLIEVRGFFTGDAPIELDIAWQIFRAARASQAVRESFLRSRDPIPHLRKVSEGIDDLSDLIKRVGRYFTSDGKLREEASPELKSIRTRLQAKRRSIQKTLTDLMNRNSAAIQEPLITIRGDRYCIPVRTDHAREIPGILHERSGSGASLFIEPMQVVELNNELASLLIDERQEIARLTRLIASELLAAAEAIATSVEVAGALDGIQACAIFFSLVEASRPTFTTSRTLSLREARHPLLDQRLNAARAAAFGETEGSTAVIPATIELTEERPVLLISGPNAGGKTVALKAAGLLVAMACSGLPVPANDGSVIPVLDRLHVLIGDDQSVLDHLSTFSAYLTRLRSVVTSVTPRSLVLLDELGSGTDPEEGGALAAAVIEHLVRAGALVLATTHLSSLKSFATDDQRIVNASMEFDSDSGRPTFRLITGVPGRSRAIEVAKMIGLPAAIIDRARERVGEEFGRVDRLVSDLHSKMQQVRELEKTIEKRTMEMEREQTALRSKLEETEKERAALAERFRKEIERFREDATETLRSEIRRLRDRERTGKQAVTAGRLADEIVEITTPALAGAQTEPAAVGDQVEHRRLKFKGELTALSGNRATISVGGRKIEAMLDDLRPLERAAKSKRPQNAKREVTRPLDTIEPAVTAELNLIGHRVEEALEESDKFLDRSLMDGKGAVRLIHGFGTGALRKALREHLRKHPAVRSFRPGSEREGGDGATVAILDV